MKKLRTGLIGCGSISSIYLKTCQQFDIIDLVACSSLDREEAQDRADAFAIPSVCAPEEIIQDPDIECILNLTIPAAHAEISLAALHANKHVYSEKPFATNIEDGKEILSLAESKGLYVGNAPDTFLGGRLQTCRRLIEEGLIGSPIAVTACAGTHGVERHHPNPAFYYKPGGGPVLDLAPYYLTAMVALFGPIKQCSAFAKKSFAERIIESQARRGEIIEVEVDTHVCGNLEFANGIIGSIMVSFDVWDSQMPRLEIYGTDGSISIADPDPTGGANIFGGRIYYKTKEKARWNYRPRVEGLEEWDVAINKHRYNEDSRGLGFVDMAYAIQNKRAHRANGKMAHHVLEIMLGLLESSKTNRCHVIESSCEIPAALPENFPQDEALEE